VLRLALISLVLAIVLALLSRLPRRVLALVGASVAGVLLGLLTFVTDSMTRVCDYGRPPRVDTCSGVYVSIFGEHRLPQFMQGDYAGSWLIVAAGLVGAVVAVLGALLAIWGWARLRPRRLLPGTA